MKRATCVHFITQFKEVLLPYQQEKVVGRKGFGGKIEGQTPLESSVKEVDEESGRKKEFRLNPEEEGGITFDPKDLLPVAVIDFYNGTEQEVPYGNPSFRVIFYNCYRFEGKAIDTIEMRDARYYPIANLPFDEMPVGDHLFMEDILNQKYRTGWVRMTANFGAVLGYSLKPCTTEELVI